MPANKIDVCTRGHNMDETRKFHPNGDSYCSECKRIRTKESRKNNPRLTAVYSRRTNLRRYYGLEESEYDALFDSQQGKCAICQKDLERISRSTHIDHCHSSGKIRGILCHHCNTAIGLLGDDVEKMKAAIEYLEKK